MPTLWKFLCAMIVLVSLFICLIPKIFTSIDPEADQSGGASGVAGILWPLCFMFGFVSDTSAFKCLRTIFKKNKYGSSENIPSLFDVSACHSDNTVNYQWFSNVHQHNL